MTSTVNNLTQVSTLLKTISGSLGSIQTQQQAIIAGWPAMAAAAGGPVGGGAGAPASGGGAAGVGIPAAKFGAGTAAGTSGTGTGGTAGTTGPPPMFTSKGAVATMAVGSFMFGTAPDPAKVMSNALSFYQTGLGSPGYNSLQYQDSMRKAMLAGGGGMLNGADLATATSTLNRAGFGANQAMTGRAMTDVARLNSTFNMGAENAAGLVGKMSSGEFIGNAYRFGMQLSDRKGNPLSADQSFEAIYKRLYPGGKPTAASLQNMYRAGGLRKQLMEGVGFSEEESMQWLKWASARAEKGPGTTIASLGETAGNRNPLRESGAYKLGAQEAEKMTDAQASVMKGYRTAAELIAKVNEAYMMLPQAARDVVNATKAASAGIRGNSVGANMMSTMGGTMGALGVGSLVRGLISNGGVSGLLTKGARQCRFFPRRYGRSESTTEGWRKDSRPYRCVADCPLCRDRRMER
jgi:hypothetical protein